MTTKIINLELGDIIKLHSPSNDTLNDKSFIISFINDNMIDLNSADLNTTLNLDQGKLTDESIVKITILYKNKLKGFIKQNGLELNTWLDIYFNQDVPVIITGEITEITEDMIEFKTYPNNDVLYIDFSYNGIPKEFNIEKIHIRDKPTIESVDFPSAISVDEERRESDDITSDMFEDDLLNMPSIQGHTVNIQNEIIEGSKIVFGESMGELIQVVDVDDKLKRYDLDTQINDLLDELLSKIPKHERTYTVINEIHTFIERFKQLREEFSSFDSTGNIVEKVLKGSYNKPLKDKLLNLSKRVPWILPVVINKKKIYNIENDDNQYIIPIELTEDLTELDEITKQTDNTDESFTLFQNILKQIKPYYEPFEQYMSDVSIINKEANTLIESITNIDDFRSFAVKNEDIHNIKFQLSPYLKGETLNIIGLLVLPKKFITNSMKYLPGMNIRNKSLLNQNNLLLSDFLNRKTRLETIEISNTKTEYEYDKFYDNIKYIVSTADEKNYDEFVDTIIPKIKGLIGIIRTNIKETDIIVSYNTFMASLEPFHVYYSDLTFSHFKEINDIIYNEITKYKKKFMVSQKGFEKYANIRNSEFRNYQTYYSRIYNLPESYQMFRKRVTPEEFIKNCLQLDSGKFLQSNISNINFRNFSGIKLDETSIREKLITLSKDETNKCDKYIISKEYSDIKKLEIDNGKDIYYDTDKDTTRYDILDEVQVGSIAQDDKEALFAFYKQFLIDNVGVSDQMAVKDARAMVDKRRLVDDGDLCILNNDGKITYYRRKSNTWSLDTSINESSFKNKTKLLCNTEPLCISMNVGECESIDNIQTQHNKEELNRILTSFEIEKMKKEEDARHVLLLRYEYALHNLQYLNKYKPNTVNNTKLDINNKYIMSETKKSPHSKLLNAILGQNDFPKKQNDIIKFMQMFTVSGETKYVRNCKDTGIKLFPSFLGVLAHSFISGSYSESVEQICKEQGEISDNGDTWVDKHSGMVIKYIDFSTEEGYDDSGYKVVSRDILDNGIDLNLLMNDPKKLQGDKGIIFNVISSITNFIGISLKTETIDELLDEIIKVIKDKVPEKALYDKKRAMAMKKGSKIPTYEITYYNVLLLSSISLLFIVIQTSQPPIKAKKSFPGCVKSFMGYPLQDESNVSGIKYMACIANKMKTDSIPWNTVKKMKEESIEKQLILFIKSISENNVYIQNKVREKNEYLQLNPDDDYDKMSPTISWSNFLPPLKTDFKQEFVPFTTSYFEGFSKNFKSSDLHYLYYILSKIHMLTLHNFQNTNDTIKLLPPSIVTNIGIPHLENSSDLTRFNEITNWYNIKNNDLANAYMEYYNYMKVNAKANIRLNNMDTKLKYDKLTNDLSEDTVYNTFIHYCLKKKHNDEDLMKLCKIGKDSRAQTKEELKSSGVTYNDAEFSNLLQYIFGQSIIRSDIKMVLPVPDPLNSDLSNFNILYMPLLEFSKKSYDSHKKLTDNLRNYVLEYNEAVKTNVLSAFSNDLSYTKQNVTLVETYFDSIDLWNDVNGSLTINTIELTTNTNINFLYNTIISLCRVFPNMILNAVDYRNINIRKNLKLSERHILTIQTFVHAEFQPLEGFYHNDTLNTLLQKIITNGNEIIKYLEEGPLMTIRQSSTIEKNVLGYETLNEIFHYFISLTLNMYVTEMENTQDFTLKKTIGDIIFTYVKMIRENKNTLNMTQEEMYSKLLKYKEIEKSEITTYLRDITDELREIENVMKNNKLGKWSKGQTKGLVTYTADTYDGEMIQDDIRATQQDVAMDIAETEKENDELSNETIMNEEMNLAMLAEDDDFGNYDGDEGF